MKVPMTDPRYPIGRLEYPPNPTAELREEWLKIIEETPAKLRQAVEALTPEQLDTPYRPGGWTPRQVVHHLADSHMNSFIRFKLALTEEEPVIKPYLQGPWAELPDSKAPVELSLSILDALHARWMLLLRSLKPEDFARTFQHPERGPLTLEKNIALYAWHGPHHIAHVLLVQQSKSPMLD
jgi:hypothetical protein